MSFFLSSIGNFFLLNFSFGYFWVDSDTNSNAKTYASNIISMNEKARWKKNKTHDCTTLNHLKSGCRCFCSVLMCDLCVCNEELEEQKKNNKKKK